MFKWVAESKTQRQQPAWEERTPNAGRSTAREDVHKAWQDWQAAIRYFESVCDPELVDYAIYEVEAARRRYMYMLKHVKNGEWDV